MLLWHFYLVHEARKKHHYYFGLYDRNLEGPVVMFTKCEFGWVYSCSELDCRLMCQDFPYIKTSRRNASLPRKRPKNLTIVALTEATIFTQI